MEERTPPSISILGQVAQCNAHEGDCAAAALGLGAFRELLSKHTNHRGRCMLMLGEAEIVCQSIQLLCHIAALRSPEPRCTGSHSDDHEIMAKRPALLDLTLELLPYEGTNDFSFNCICALSRLSAFRWRARTTPASGSSPGWRCRPSSLSRRCDSSTLKSCSSLALKHRLPSLSVASSQLCIFSLFAF